MNPMKYFFTTILTLTVFFPALLRAQITTDPAVPTADEPVRIYFDASGTGLEGYNQDVYAHTGLTIDDNKWQYVIGDWGNNTNQPQLTFISNDYYKLEITPSIREYYGAAAGDNITQMDFVFRSADQSQQTSPDIFVDVFEIGLNVILVAPEPSPYFVDPGQIIEVSAESTLSQTLSLYVDDELVATTTENQLLENITASTDQDTKHWIKAVAEDNSGNVVADSNYYYVRGASAVEALPDGVRDGINYIDAATVTLVLHAPYKNSVYVLGDFNNWQVGPQYKLKCTTADVNDYDTRYWVTLDNLTPGQEYAFQYLIDEDLRLADAYTDKVLDPWNDQYISESTYPNLKPYPTDKTTGIVSVLQTDQQPYQWQVQNFEAPAPTNLVVYELLVRDFIAAHDFQTLKDTISYFKRLGINAIELMPVSEFEGNSSWGYNPSFYFAPDKYYGPRDAMKAFVDSCHANGIAVIMDMVLNHAYGQNVFVQMYWDAQNNRPAANNLWFNAVCPHEPFCWGYDFNHESPATHAFVDSITHYWMSEYNIDGYRFDFTQGFTNNNGGGSYDQDRINIIERMSDAIWSVKDNAYVILEHWTDNSEEKVLANYGCMLWGNLNYNYNEATMGYTENGKSDFSWISYQERGWNDPHVMGYMESHDEERLMYKNETFGNAAGNYNITDTTTALKRQELAYTFFFTIPGPKMIWEFGERGYDYSINWPSGEDYDRLTPKPPRWDYMNDYRREYLYHVAAALIDLKKNYNVFETTNYSLDVHNALKSVVLDGSDMDLVAIGNFDVVEGSYSPTWPATGTWYEFYTQTTLDVSSTTQAVDLQPGEYRLYTSSYIKSPDWLNTGISENITTTDNLVRVYPNPSQEGFIFDFRQNDAAAAVSIAIFDLYGTEVASADIRQKQAWQWHPARSLPAGMYFARITTNGKTQTIKLIRK